MNEFSQIIENFKKYKINSLLHDMGEFSKSKKNEITGLTETKTNEVQPHSYIKIDEEGKIIECISKAFSELKLTKDSVIGKKLCDILPAEVKSKVLRTIFTVSKTNSSLKDYYSFTINDHTILFEVRFLPSEKKQLVLVLNEITSEQKIQSSLTSSEVKFFSVWENSFDGMRLLDINGNIVAVNSAFCKMIGRKREDILGKPFYSVCRNSPNEDIEEYFQLFKKPIVKSKFGSTFERELINSSGKLIYVEGKHDFIDTHDGNNYLLTIFKDISERKENEKLKSLLNQNKKNEAPKTETEKALKISEEKYKVLVEASPNAIVMMNLKGEVVMANKKMAKLFGYRKTEEAIGKNAYDFVIPKERKHIRRYIRGAFQQGSLKEIEFVLFREDRSQFPAEINISLLRDIKQKPYALIVVIKDISKRKIAENALRNSEARFRAVWESSINGMRVSDAWGNTVAVNKAFCELVDMEEKDIIGKPFYEIYQTDENIDRKEYLRFSQERLLNRKIETHRQVKSTFRSGKTVDLEVTYSLMEVEKDEPLLLSIFHDITHRKKVEENLRHSEKLAAIGKMAAYLSHEIKTPLATIEMNIDMLKRGLMLSRKKQRSFEIVQKEVKRLDKLLKNVLQFSRQVDVVYVNLNLSKLIGDIKEFLNPTLIEREISLVNNVDLLIQGDYQKLQTVLLHLIENSVEAISNNGIIEVYSKIDEENNSASLFIKDSGSGIPDNKQIFDPFYTTKTAGTGLGLAIAQKNIEQHDGALKLVSSKPGETIFEIKFNNYKCEYGKNFNN